MKFEFHNWDDSKSFQHIPFKNPFAKTAAEEQVKTNIDQHCNHPGAQQIEEPVPDGDVTGYSPPVTDDFQLPGPHHRHHVADDHVHVEHNEPMMMMKVVVILSLSDGDTEGDDDGDGGRTHYLHV